MTNPVQQSPYLRQQRNFPQDNMQKLTVEIDHSYIDIATKMNEREIAIYPIGTSIVSGQQWFLAGQPKRQQALRQVFPFSSTASITHGITGYTLFSGKSSGSYTDGTNWYGLIFGSNTAIAGQLGFYVTPTQIVFTNGGGASSLSSGYVILEWVSQY